MKAKENGGTLLGLIIGLIVGLAIAIVVAVTITKVSTPFTNKLGMTKPADTPVVQITDPNKPLYGNSYKEAPPVTEQNQSSVKEDEDAIKEFADNAGKYAGTENGPEVEKLPPKPAQNEVAAQSAEEKSTFYLQVGAFRDPADAENVRAKLALLDIESSVSKKKLEYDNLYRVRIGPFNKMDEMNQVRRKLVENSIDVAVIKTPK